MLSMICGLMSEPDFARENDGYALASEIGRVSHRSVAAVHKALKTGEEEGLFTSRPHPTRRNGVTGGPALEYKAVARVTSVGERE